MPDPFEIEKEASIVALGEREDLIHLSNTWLREVSKHQYSYHFTWMGLPIIQFPQDMVAMQEIVWDVRPDLIVETGVARGGSLVFYASLLEIIGGNGRVLGIDIDIRAPNRAVLDAHPMRKRIDLLEGTSIGQDTIERVAAVAVGKERVLVALDSSHTHEHVLAELRLYSQFVTKGSYIVAFDTIVEDMPSEFYADRPWGPGNNPYTAVIEFLKTADRFEMDRSIAAKLQVTAARHGYLRCVKD